MNTYEIFLKYALIPTMSDDESETIPSTKKQLVLAELLKDQLLELGLADARVDEYGYVYATLPANVEDKIDAIGFIAHMDTSSEASDENIKPQIVEYKGGDILNEDDIDINLKALISMTEKYGVREGIRSVLNIGSASAHTGAEFPEYCASKGGVLAYTKNVAMRIAKYGATCNSLDPGGVLTPLNECVMNDPELWAQIMDETPLKKWATPEEIAEWAYFLTVVNTFCTGQCILVDGGESINYHFIWKD